MFSSPQRVCVCVCARTHVRVCMRARSLCACVSLCDKEKSPHCQTLENATCCVCILIFCKPLSHEIRRENDLDLTVSRHLECVSNLKLTRQGKRQDRTKPTAETIAGYCWINLALAQHFDSKWQKTLGKSHLRHLRNQCCGLKPLNGRTFHFSYFLSHYDWWLYDMQTLSGQSTDHLGTVGRWVAASPPLNTMFGASPPEVASRWELWEPTFFKQYTVACLLCVTNCHIPHSSAITAWSHSWQDVAVLAIQQPWLVIAIPDECKTPAWVGLVYHCMCCTDVY